MTARRVIACLDVRNGRVVKGVQFADVREAGDIEVLAQRYRDAGVDELVFYDITASPERRTADASWVARVAALLDVPFCVAGGIRSVEDAERLLHAGADKISVNSPALAEPALIERLAARFGSQCVVVGIDSLCVDDDWLVRQYAGDATQARLAGRRTLEWLGEVQDRGAGEVVLNCIDRDGMRDGFDIEQLAVARAHCRVPLIASGGAGTPTHFVEAFTRADVDGALAAGAFHDGSLRISDVKRVLAAQGLEVRC